MSPCCSRDIIISTSDTQRHVLCLLASATPVHLFTLKASHPLHPPSINPCKVPPLLPRRSRDGPIIILLTTTTNRQPRARKKGHYQKRIRKIFLARNHPNLTTLRFPCPCPRKQKTLGFFPPHPPHLKHQYRRQ